MAVQPLRSCYETDCRPYYDSDTTVRMRWYFVPEGTASLPFGTVFQSGAWLDEPEGETFVGEVPGADRTWKNGRAPFPTTFAGPPCGSAELFAHGDTIANAGAPLNVYGAVQCCPLPASPFLHTDCRSCPNGAWDVFTLLVQGGTGTQAQYNGMYVLTYRGSCTWNTNSILYPDPAPHDCIWSVTVAGVAPTNVARVFLLDLVFPDGMEFETLLNYDCTVTADAQLVTGPAGSPARVTLIPGILTEPGAPLCGNLSGGTSPVYYLTFPIVAPSNLDEMFVIPGTYSVFQSGPCEWKGVVRTRVFRVVGAAAIIERDITVSVGPGGVATVTLSVTFAGFNPPGIGASWVSAAGWDGTSAIACMVQPYLPVYQIYPFAITLAPPILP